MLMRAAAKEYNWNSIWRHRVDVRGGCIIRSRFLGEIKKAFDKNPKLTNLMLEQVLAESDQAMSARLRAVVATAAKKASDSRIRHCAGLLTTGSAANVCRRTCFRPSGTISARTPTSAWTNRAANSSTRMDRSRRRCGLRHLQRVKRFPGVGSLRGGTPVSAVFSICRCDCRISNLQQARASAMPAAGRPNSLAVTGPEPHLTPAKRQAASRRTPQKPCDRIFRRATPRSSLTRNAATESNIVAARDQLDVSDDHAPAWPGDFRMASSLSRSSGSVIGSL